MSGFLSTLKTEQTDKWTHTLLGDLIFEDEELGTIKVPSGFSTDFASIRSLHNVLLFVLYALTSGYGNYAATVHDFLYTTHSTSDKDVSRKQADDVLYRALRAEGIAKWRSWLFWAGVRVGGKSAYLK